MDTKMDEQSEGLRPVHPGRVAAGAVFVAVGVALWLDQTEWMGGYAWRAFPGFVLIALGATGLIGNWRTCAGKRGSPFTGLWLMCIGTWLIFNGVNAFGFTYERSWPLLVIAGGTVMVLRELFGSQRSDRPRERN
jgi:LiaF transmembrane domain